jgi:transposase InsO family protein
LPKAGGKWEIKFRGCPDVGRDKFFEILRNNELLIEPVKQYTLTTNSHHRFRTYSNLIKEIKIDRSNKVFVSDITYIRLKGEFCYLFLITDVYSRKIVGHSLRMNLSVDGALEAIKMVFKKIPSPEGLIHHSDRGFQYCSDSYVKLLRNNKVKISMGQSGNPYDNAIAERVNGILKTEFYLNAVFNNYHDAQNATSKVIRYKRSIENQQQRSLILLLFNIIIS